MRSARILKLEDVKQPQDLVQEIEPKEQAGDLLIDEALFEEDKDDLPNEQLRKSVAYLLWIKETYNLLQKALDDIVQITSTLISAAVMEACVNSPGHIHFWISVSSFVIGWDQNQNKANLAERYWKREEGDYFFLWRPCCNAVVSRNKIR